MQIILTEDEYNALKSRAGVSSKETETAARDMAGRWAAKAIQTFMDQREFSTQQGLLSALRKIPFE